MKSLNNISLEIVFFLVINCICKSLPIIFTYTRELDLENVYFMSTSS